MMTFIRVRFPVPKASQLMPPPLALASVLTLGLLVFLPFWMVMFSSVVLNT